MPEFDGCHAGLCRTLLAQMPGFVVRSIIAVLAGAAITAVLFQVGAAVAFVVLYGIPLGASPEPPGAGYFVMNLGFAGIAAVGGGRLTASLARQGRRTHVGALALVLAAMALWSFSRPASQWSGWYPPVLALVGVVGTLAGGLHRQGR
jgi:hypothetical protein